MGLLEHYLLLLNNWYDSFCFGDLVLFDGLDNWVYTAISMNDILMPFSTVSNLLGYEKSKQQFWSIFPSPISLILDNNISFLSAVLCDGFYFLFLICGASILIA